MAVAMAIPGRSQKRWEGVFPLDPKQARRPGARRRIDTQCGSPWLNDLAADAAPLATSTTKSPRLLADHGVADRPSDFPPV